MNGRLSLQVGMAAASAAVLASATMAAQTPPASPGEVTTVTPLVVKSREGAPIPVPPFTPLELTKSAATAHDVALGALMNACNRGISEDEENLTPLDRRNSLALTDARASANLELAAREARTATLAADNLRNTGSAAALAAAEETRETSVKVYLAAQKVAAEAHQRFTDFQDIIDSRSGYAPRLAEARHMPWTGWAMGNPPIPPPDSEIMALLNESTRQRLEGNVAPGVYVPGEYADLRLAQVRASEVQLKGGDRAIHITGRIINPRQEVIPVPPLWVTAVDEYNRPLKSEQIKTPSGRRIQAGGNALFAYDLRPAPPNTQNTLVTFAPQERTRRDRPILGSPGFCPQDEQQLKEFREGRAPPPEASWINGSHRTGTTKPWAFQQPIRNPFYHPGTD